MKSKIDFKAVLAAAAGGAGFTVVTEAIARNNEYMATNYSQAKGALGIGIGTALLYFGKGEAMKAAGYAIIGDGGGSLGSMVATRMAQSDAGTNVQGVRNAAITAYNRGRKSSPARLKELAAKAKAIAPAAALAQAKRVALVSNKTGRPVVRRQLSDNNIAAAAASRRSTWRTGPRAHLYS